MMLSPISNVHCSDLGSEDQGYGPVAISKSEARVEVSHEPFANRLHGTSTCRSGGPRLTNRHPAS